MSDDNSSVTSIDDDNTENFVENPTRELLAEGFLGFFSPIIENLDSKVKQTQYVSKNLLSALFTIFFLL
jgi:SNARE-associated protein Snapin